MFFLAQKYFYKELDAGRLEIYDPNLTKKNAKEVFFEIDYFPVGDNGIKFEFTVLGLGFSASYSTTMPQVLTANEREAHNVRFVETILIERLY